MYIATTKLNQQQQEIQNQRSRIAPKTVIKSKLREATEHTHQSTLDRAFKAE